MVGLNIIMQIETLEQIVIRKYFVTRIPSKTRSDANSSFGLTGTTESSIMKLHQNDFDEITLVLFGEREFEIAKEDYPEFL